MDDETFSAYHEFLAVALARELNAYHHHSVQMNHRLALRDTRGNPPVYTAADRSTTEESRLKIILLAATYVEALANLYLSLKLNDEQFSAVDRLDLVAKWVSLPSLFLAGYSIPKNGSLYGDLKTLIAQRNAIAHMKTRITSKGRIIHEGNLPKRIHIHSQIERWDRLPANLVDHVGKHDTSLEFQKFKALSSIDNYARIRKQS